MKKQNEDFNKTVNELSDIEDKFIGALQNFFKTRKIFLGIIMVSSVLLMSIK